MIVPTKYEILCKILIKAFRHKFNHEKKCPIYNVAALLNVAKLDKGYGRSDCTEMRRKGIDSLLKVAEQFNLKNIAATISNSQQDTMTSSAIPSVVDSMEGILEDDD